MTTSAENDFKNLPQKAEWFIPHSDRMCVVDDLIRVEEKESIAAAVVSASSPFADEDGKVDESIFIEMIAQTIAAGNGFKLTAEERLRQEGYLLGIRNMKITRPARTGEQLLIRAVKSAEFGNFGIIEGLVSCGDEVLAAGEIKVFQKVTGEETDEK